MDTIELSGIKFKTKIGVYVWEQQKTQILILNLLLGMDNQAKISDNLEDTIDYAELVTQIRNRYIQKSFNLLEALAEDIASFLLNNFNILSVEIKLIKPGILPEVQQVSLNIKRTRQEH